MSKLKYDLLTGKLFVERKPATRVFVTQKPGETQAQAKERAKKFHEKKADAANKGKTQP